jgi:uncharacterized protein (UPF0333 family)
MKQMKNKGQGAMEYLMTYGWAILVVMIVGVVLWQLGVFNFGQGTVVPKDWNKMQPLVPTITYNGAAQTFTASFNNVGGTSAKLTRINVTETYSNATCGTVYIGTVRLDSGTGNVTVAPGSAFKMDAATCPLLNRGDQYLMTITLTYNAVVGGISTSHTEIGTIRGNAE